MQTQTETTPFEGWCILELMGHRRLAGYVKEVTLAGAGLLRVDIPGDESAGVKPATQFYPPGSLYCLTPTTEEVARAVAASSRPSPVNQWELKALPASVSTPTGYGDDFNDDDKL